jgi:hypothetical protein
MTQPLPPGTAVVLVAPQASYETGARGVVLRTSVSDATILVRFDETGHALFLPRDSIRVVGEATGSSSVNPL